MTEKKEGPVWTEGNRVRELKEARGKQHKGQEGLEVCIGFGVAQGGTEE